MKTVYKIVNPTDDPHVFLSYWAYNPMRQVYFMGEVTKSDTPLFAFATLDAAVEFLCDEVGLTILIGETTQFHRPYSHTILPPHYLDDKDRIESFWRDEKMLSPIELRGKYMWNTAPRSTVFCYDFKPIGTAYTENIQESHGTNF